MSITYKAMFWVQVTIVTVVLLILATDSAGQGTSRYHSINVDNLEPGRMHIIPVQHGTCYVVVNAMRGIGRLTVPSCVR